MQPFAQMSLSIRWWVFFICYDCCKVRNKTVNTHAKAIIYEWIYFLCDVFFLSGYFLYFISASFCCVRLFPLNKNTIFFPARSVFDFEFYHTINWFTQGWLAKLKHRTVQGEKNTHLLHENFIYILFLATETTKTEIIFNRNSKLFGLNCLVLICAWSLFDNIKVFDFAQHLSNWNFL